MTKPIEVKTGVRQGCFLSPLLFLMVLDSRRMHMRVNIWDSNGH